jgi:CBS domain containing-hemolysin-like protein
LIGAIGTSLLPLLPWLIGMGLLICCSAFFSASEAALFYLRPSARRQLATGNASQRAADKLLVDPDRLLSAVLFWNLVINIAYFAISSMCSIKIDKDESLGQSWAIAFAIGSLLAIIFFSEMLPKSIAVINAASIVKAVGLPLSFAVRAIDPLMPILTTANLISRRILWPGFTPEANLEVADIERAIEISGKDQSVIRQEQAVLQNMVHLSDIRIDEWMRPRTQFEVFKPPVNLQDLNGQIPPSGYLLVTEPASEEIEKAIRLDNHHKLSDENLEKFAEPILYLPWSATVADALEKMSHKDREVTVVLNEFGETIGILTIEDILETVFAYKPSRSKRILDHNPIVEVEPGLWVAYGLMSVRQLARFLNLKLPTTDSVTIGGMIQATLQRLGKIGDECDWGPLHFRIVDIAERGMMLTAITFREVEADE